jgi:hypothetical protein
VGGRCARDGGACRVEGWEVDAGGDGAWAGSDGTWSDGCGLGRAGFASAAGAVGVVKMETLEFGRDGS